MELFYSVDSDFRDSVILKHSPLERACIAYLNKFSTFFHKTV